jgi:hypothetical protein
MTMLPGRAALLRNELLLLDHLTPLIHPRGVEYIPWADSTVLIKVIPAYPSESPALQGFVPTPERKENTRA